MHPNWKALATVDFPWKQFVREGSPTNLTSNDPSFVKNSSLTGDEAKRIYEEVVGSNLNLQDKPASKISEKHEKSRLSEGTSCTRRSKWVNILMTGAEKNDVACVSSLMVDGFDINVTDQFGWTALMSAACAGAVDVVKLLIERGADTRVKDKSGNTCLSLARRHGHENVVDVIMDPPSSSVSNKQIVTKSDPFYCDVCKQEFSDMTRTQHSSSTVHLLCSNQNRKVVVPTVYGIPATNKGYQILLKGGWDRERGLGPDGSGHKFPLKTVLKRDRKGLGGKCKSKARVTHILEREQNKRTMGRRARAAALNKEQRKERALRLELS